MAQEQSAMRLGALLLQELLLLFQRIAILAPLLHTPYTGDSINPPSKMGRAKASVDAIINSLHAVRTPYGRGMNSVGLVGVKTDMNNTSGLATFDGPEKIRAALRASPYSEGGKPVVMHPLQSVLEEEAVAEILFEEQRASVSGEYNIIDLGDIEFDEEDEANPATFTDTLHELGRAINQRAITPITLGGNGSVTYPIFNALATTPRVSVAHSDAGDTTGGHWVEKGDTMRDSILPFFLHFDSRPDMEMLQGDSLSELNDINAMGHICETRLYAKLTQMGVRATTGMQKNFVKDYPEVEQYTAAQIHAMTANDTAEAIRSALLVGGFHEAEVRSSSYVSIDIGVLDPAFAPGVVRPEPGGLSTRDLLSMIAAIPYKQRFMGVDISEFCPTNDINNQTAAVIAKIIKELVPKLSQRAGQMQTMHIPGKEEKPKWPWQRTGD